MEIAILGGRFDPPHIWHFWIARQVLENVKAIDQVWLLPDYKSALRRTYAPARHRVNMLAFLETSRIKLSTIALETKNVTYAIDLVKKLFQIPGNNYYWISGSDIVNEFSKWAHHQKLQRLIKFLVFPRGDHPIKSLPENFYLIKGNLILSNISSAIIRDRIRKGLSITGLVFPEVEEYIRQRNLYKVND